MCKSDLTEDDIQVNTNNTEVPFTGGGLDD